MIENSPENTNEQGSEPVLSAEQTSEKLSPKNPEKSPSKLKKALPIVLIVLALAAIITFAIIFGGTSNNSSSSVSNNINDSSINWGSYSSSEIELSDSLKITSGGVYTLSGTIEDGMIEIDAGDADVKLILNGVTITNSNGPAIYVAQADNVIIETVSGTTNTLTDSNTYTNWDEDVCAALFSHDDLVLQGEGTLIVNGNYEDGIVGKDDLKVVSGTYTINARDDALRGRDSVYVVDGTFKITSGGDGVKSNNDSEIGKGTILIDGGYFEIAAGDDGMHAETSLEVNDGTIIITKAYEGLEGASITINGGDIRIASSDDGLNAAGGNDGSSPNMAQYQSSSSNYSLTINGGRVYVTSSGDGIDSNGTLTINGGEVIVDGPVNSANGALDAEGSVTFNGGSIVAVGASGMVVAPSSSSSAYSISAFFSSSNSASTKITVKDSSGNTILEHTSQKAFQHAVLSSDQFIEGETYTIYLNDVEYATVTLSGKTTQVGSGGMMPGNQTNQGGWGRR